MLKNLTLAGKIGIVVVVALLIVGGKYGYEYAFPKKAKLVSVTTKATGIPPLAYDKGSNAPFRKLPEFNEPADVNAPEVRGNIMGWNGFAAANYAVGGMTTAKGSICEELGLNVKLSVQNSCSEQANQLYAFAQDMHDNGSANPTKGCHFVNWMADAAANYLEGLNSRIKKDFGPEYIAKVYTFTGASFGEDKWLIKPKFMKDARGSLTATVVRDGDWNIAIIKCQLMGWEVNHELGTWDRNKVNFVAAPNDDYIEAGKMYISGQKITLEIVENGIHTGRDTTMTVNGVSSWFPVDQQVVQGKGGLQTIASTADFGSQMACGLVFISAWAEANPVIMENLITAFGRGGDQIKSHDEALQFACQVSEIVFQDKEKTAQDWYNAYKSFDLTDEDGNTVNIGGSRTFSLADAAYYTGVAGGSDKYRVVYSTFGNICKEAFPEVLSSFPEYTEATDWKYLRAAYNKSKADGTAGTVSKVDFQSSQKGGVVGDASYAIQFAVGKADINPVSYPILDKVVAQLNIASNNFVEIGGHTDNTGDPQANQTLSEARARAVEAYLTGKDPDLDDKGKIKSRGYGQSAPLKGFDENSVTGRAKNRRVEIKLFRAR